MSEVDETGADERFAANVKMMREGRGWNQSEFARRLSEAGLEGFHQTTVSRIEAGSRPVRLGEATAIAQVLGVPVERLVGGGVELVHLTEIQAAMARVNAAGYDLGLAADRHKAAVVELRRALGDPSPESGGDDHSPWRIERADGSLRVLYVGWEGEDRSDPRTAARRMVSASEALKIDAAVHEDVREVVRPWAFFDPDEPPF